MNGIRSVLAGTTLFLALLTVACKDPLSEAQDIFNHQGLVLLQPARDYIVPGGLVVLPHNGGPSYLDPYDNLAALPGTDSDFKGIVDGQTQNHATGLGAAVSGIGTLLPISFDFDKKRQVALTQMDTGGQRITSPMVSALIKRDSTKEVLTKQLTQKGQKNRVFVVQEVYTAKSLSFTSADKLELQASYGTKGPIPDCTLLGGTTGSNGAKGTSDVSGTTTPSDGTTAAKGAAASKAASASTGITSGGSAPGIGASLSVCHAGKDTLTMQTDVPIAFAVRLNEIILTDSGLDIKFGRFKFQSTLGNSDVEKATAVIQPLKNLTRVTH